MTQRRKMTHETRSARARRQFWLRLGVWVFIGIFVFSVAGMALIMATVRPGTQ